MYSSIVWLEFDNLRLIYADVSSLFFMNIYFLCVFMYDFRNYANFVCIKCNVSLHKSMWKNLCQILCFIVG